MFAAAVARSTNRSLLDHSNDWYKLQEVTDAAPIAFLRECWSWFVAQAERFHSGGVSLVLYHYGGHLFSLDRDNYSHATVTSAVLSAVTKGGQADPYAFLEITRASWQSENAVVQRVLARGLTAAASSIPEQGLEFLCTDNRRLHLGDDRRDQNDSLELIGAIVPFLTTQQQELLQSTILSSSQYRKEIAPLEDDRAIWDREARLRLLKAIPEEYLSAKSAAIMKREEQELPEWNRKPMLGRSGLVREKLPLSPAEMLTAPDEDLLRMLDAPDVRDRAQTEWIEEEECWERPGGSDAMVVALRELGKEHPARLLPLIPAAIRSGNEKAAGSLAHSLAGSALSDQTLHDLVRTVAALNPQSDSLRSDIGSLLYDRSSAGLSDDLCDILERWLLDPWELSDPIRASSDGKSEDRPPVSVLWGYHNHAVGMSRPFWALMAVTFGYLRRKPAETGRWLALLDRLLDLDIGVATWLHYCSELRWIRLRGCNREVGTAVVQKMFEKHPPLRTAHQGLRLIAQVSDLLNGDTIRDCFNALTALEEPEQRQAYGELLTVIAVEDEIHGWCIPLLEEKLASITESVQQYEAEAIGTAFAAARLWDNYEHRARAAAILCRLIPVATPKVAYAIGTVFTAADNFPADEHTEVLLQSLAAHPSALAGEWVMELAEHLAKLLPHCRQSVLHVCEAIVHTYQHQLTSFQYHLYGAGPYLVNIAMTLQRFPDTRSDGLTLLESLLKLGLDAAFASLPDMELRPVSVVRCEPRPRRRRARG